VVVGVPLANRSRPGSADVVGQFVNTVPIRLAADGGLGFPGLQRAAGTAVADAVAHQELPSGLMDSAAAGSGDLSALLGVTFNLLDGDVADSQAGLSALDLDTGRSDSDLALTLERRGDELHGVLTVARDVYPDLDLPRVIAAYLAVLRGVTADPAISGAALQAIARAEIG
jgi:hypothetical protein